MKKVIILEGPDNIGKTTLAQDLSASINAEINVRHFGPPKEKGEKALQEQLETLRRETTAIQHGNGIEIWDRSFIGEMVYGPMYRTTQYAHSVYEKEMLTVCKKLSQRIFVVCLFADLEWYKKMEIKPKKDEKTKYQMMSDAENIAIAFVNVVTRLPLQYRLLVNCHNYPTFDVRNIYIANRVRGWLKAKPFVHTRADSYRYSFFNTAQRLWDKRKGLTRDVIQCSAFEDKSCGIGRDHRRTSEYGKMEQAPTEGCGAIDPKYVFVGEAPGKNGCGKLGIPFYNDPSGNLLQDTLTYMGILPTEYYMTNVVKCTPLNSKLADYVDHTTRKDLECVRELSVELQRMKVTDRTTVIAIGKVADYELTRLNIPHTMILHPAYYLRNGKRYEFIRDFRKLVKG